jgi:hypothetical protein
MSIHDDSPKIKRVALRFLGSQKGHDVMVFLIILGVSVAGFSLGTMSVKRDQAKVIIEADPSLVLASAADYTTQLPSQNTNGANSFGENNPAAKVSGSGGEASGKTSGEPGGTNDVTGTSSLPYVASKKGKKYYPVGCARTKSLSEANRIYFKDTTEAEAKGYTMSTSCK